MQPLAVKRAGRRSGGSGGSSGGGNGFGRRGKDDGAEASKDPEKRLANLNRKLTSILEVRSKRGGVMGVLLDSRPSSLLSGRVSDWLNGV